MFGDIDWPLNASRRFVNWQHQLSFLIPGISNFQTASFYDCIPPSIWMTDRHKAITHTRKYRVLPGRGGTVYIYYFRSFCEAKPVPPDTKFWRRHWLSYSCKIWNTVPFRSGNYNDPFRKLIVTFRQVPWIIVFLVFHGTIFFYL